MVLMLDAPFLEGRLSLDLVGGLRLSVDSVVHFGE
jgi:hypothetical protein